jgi:hypothetical protein
VPRSLRNIQFPGPAHNFICLRCAHHNGGAVQTQSLIFCFHAAKRVKRPMMFRAERRHTWQRGISRTSWPIFRNSRVQWCEEAQASIPTKHGDSFPKCQQT